MSVKKITDQLERARGVRKARGQGEEAVQRALDEKREKDAAAP